MADKIRKIKLGSTTYDIKDDEAVSTINGYSNTDVNAGNVMFATTPITEQEITDLVTPASN